MVVGIGENSGYIASDMAALLSVTRDFYIIEDGELVDISNGEIRITDLEGKALEHPVFTSRQKPVTMSIRARRNKR